MPTLVSTGQITLVDVNDGLHARLTSEQHTVPAEADGTAGDYTGCATTLTVLMGAQDVSDSWTVVASPTVGITGSLVGRTYTVTDMATDAGYVDLTASCVGYPDLVSRFSISKSKRGQAGPAITLVSSAQGFSFRDNEAYPANQSIAFTVIRQNAYGPVQFFATGDAALVSDEGQLTLSNYTLGVPGTGDGETCYLDLSAFGDNQQVTVTAVVGELTATQTIVRLDSSTAQAGATRNVYRGNWISGIEYAAGDTVIDGGYGWACNVDHTSSAGVNNPPTYPAESNTWWSLASVKGDDAKVAMLTASSFVFKVAQDGTLSPSSIALSAVGQGLTGDPTFTVTSGVAVLTGSGQARTLSAASLSSDQATIKITWDGCEDYVTVTKVKEGASGLTVVVTNENHSLPAGTDGSVSSYTGSGTKIRVYEGGTALSASASATVSAFRIGTITQAPAATLTVGGVSYAGTEATIAAHSAMANGTDSVTLTIPITVYRADGSSSTIEKVQTLSKAKQGTAGVSSVAAALSNEAHAFSAASDGTVSSYTGSGTTITVYEGAGQLAYDGVGTANGTWKVTTSASNITVGSLTDSGTYLTVGDHSGVAAGTDTATITYTITGKTLLGTAFSFTKQQSFTKSKAGQAGAQGPAVSVTANRAVTFNATDGTLDGGQADIVFTASVSGVASPTYAWSFSGFQTAPSNSGAASQTITAAQFGTASSATVSCTVNGTYTDKITIVRLEKSTADAGATVGADDSNLQTGRGINLLYNAGMSLTYEGWNPYVTAGDKGLNLPDWCIKDGGSSYGTLWLLTPQGTSDSGVLLTDDAYRVPVTPGKRYEVYAYTGAHRCDVSIALDFFDANGNNLGYGDNITLVNSAGNASEASGGKALKDYKQIGRFATAPTNAATARFVIWKGATYAGQSVASYAFITLPYLGEATEGQTTLSPWAEGSSSINTKITSGNVAAYISSAAIGAAQIGSLALVGNFSVKSGLTGQRVEMDANGGRVYDSNNVLRVRWGVW